MWIHRALIFLVISCPCALVISVPLSFFGGIGGASKCGILVKGSNYLEALAGTETVVFDKTGTLTKGSFRVTAVHPDEISEDRLLELAALAESYSSHPIALSLRAAYGKEPDETRVSGVEEVSGRGVKATVDGRKVCAGNGKLMDEAGAVWHDCHLSGTTVHVAVDGEYAGHIVISDEVKEDAREAVSALREAGVRKTVMLTGDAEPGRRPGGEGARTRRVPRGPAPGRQGRPDGAAARGKIPARGARLRGRRYQRRAVLSRADIGIAMGGLGSDAAIEAADVVIMDDRPSKLAAAIKISRRTLAIVRQNIVFALAVKALVLLLGALGDANMWEAVFADVGVSVIAILNATRALNVKNL